MATMVLQIGGGVLLLLAATIVFDALHWMLHQWAASPHTLWRSVGNLHQTHHRFLDRELIIHEEWMWPNVWRHVVPEYLVQVAVTLACIPLLPQATVITALLLETLVFVIIMWGKPGFDINHHAVERLLPYRRLYFCVPEYHLLHHRYPSAHFSSWIKTLDHWLATGTALRDRRILMTGAETALGRKLFDALHTHGALVSTATSMDTSVMEDAEVLLLCHAETKDSEYVNWMETFYGIHRDDRFPVEIWALARGGDEHLACEWLQSGRVNYRHIDLTAADATANDAERVLKNIRKGFNIIPVRSVCATAGRYWQLLRK